MKSYDYARRDGVEEISWDRFFSMTGSIAEQLAGNHIDIVVGIARAGLFPATLVSTMLRKELYPVRITRRYNDEVVFRHPVWKQGVPAAVSAKTVALVDEISDSGETLRVVKKRILKMGAKAVVTAVLVSHGWADPAPDIVSLISDALIIFPWCSTVYEKGQWQHHPELVEALQKQRKEPH